MSFLRSLFSRKKVEAQHEEVSKMTDRQAFEALLAGEKLTTKSMRDDEFIHLVDGQLHNHLGRCGLYIGTCDEWLIYEEKISLTVEELNECIAVCGSGTFKDTLEYFNTKRKEQ